VLKTVSKDNFTVRSIKFILLIVAAIIMMPFMMIEFILKSAKLISSFLCKIIRQVTGVRISPTEEALYVIKLGIIGLCLVGISMVAMMPMFLHSYPMAHSTAFNFNWAFQYQRQFWSGQFYPRWLEFSNFGFGNPTFVFYPPMWAIATLPFSLFGMDFPESIVGSMVLAAFTLASGVYFYAALYFPSWLALVVSGLAVASPYFLIDVYQRGAIAEVWAITLIPWVLLATHQLISQIHLPQMQRTHAFSLAIAWGMIGLSHLPTLLITFLAWIPMPLCLLKDVLRNSSLRNYAVEVGRCYFSASLGFMGISFFLLPVIFDQKLVQIELVNPSPEYLPQNRLLLDGLVSLHPKLPNHWFETSSGMIPYFWIVLSVVIISAIAWIFNHFCFVNKSSQVEPIIKPELSIFSQPSLDSTTFFLIIASAIAVFMTTDLTSWIYQLSPTLQKIQFSWRWYSLVVTTIPFLLGSLFWRLWQQIYINRTKQNSSVKADSKPIIQSILMICLMICLVINSHIYTDKIVFQHTGFDPKLITKFSNLVSQKQFPKEPHAEVAGTPVIGWSWLFPDGLGIMDVFEYRPKGVSLILPPQQSQPLAAWQEGNREQHIQIKRWQYGLREISVDNQLSLDTVETSKYLALRMFYYPAWQVWIDGKKTLLEATSQGQAQIAVPKGQHLILVKYVGTKSEQWGRAISWLGIILAGYVLWLTKRGIIESVAK
jgi:hypothetical protein